MRVSGKCQMGSAWYISEPHRIEQLHVNKVATEKNKVGVEGLSFSDDPLEARDIVGMGASMKIGKKKYSERMRPPRPTIDYEPQSANQMWTRPSNVAKPTFSAELVSKGWPRNGADQTIPQNLPKHISIQAIIPISQRFGATRPNGISFYSRLCDHSSEE
jgi:hypothetical protein